MKKNVKIFVPLILAFIIGSLTFAFAQTGNGGKQRPGGDAGRRGGGDGFRPGGLPPHILDRLNLTDAQKTQISALQDAARTASQTYFETIRTADEQLRTMVAGGTFNETQARTVLNTKTQALTELEIIRLRTDAAIFNLLTAEQKTLLAQLLAQRPDFPPHGGGRPEGRQN